VKIEEVTLVVQGIQVFKIEELMKRNVLLEEYDKE